MRTIQVYWRNKFNGALVTINADDFDASIHRRADDGPWPSTSPAPKQENPFAQAAEASPRRNRPARK